jgi:hypothetical protein
MEVGFDQGDPGLLGRLTDCTVSDRIAIAKSVGRVNTTPRKDHH